MSSMTTSWIVFAFVFGGAVVGMFLGALLPEQHLNTSSRDIVRLGMGLVVTMSALVLGLLVASAKSNFDAQNNEVIDLSAKVDVLDRVLAHYGPEAAEARGMLRAMVTRTLDQMWSETPAASAPSSGGEVFYDKILALAPKNDEQRAFRAQALSIAMTLGQTRWLMYEQSTSSVSKPLLGVLVFWLTIIFISFGLYAPKNPTVVVSLLASALAASGAVYLMLEMYRPYAGLIQVSNAPLRAALAHLGQ